MASRESTFRSVGAGMAGGGSWREERQRRDKAMNQNARIAAKLRRELRRKNLLVVKKNHQSFLHLCSHPPLLCTDKKGKCVCVVCICGVYIHAHVCMAVWCVPLCVRAGAVCMRVCVCVCMFAWFVRVRVRCVRAPVHLRVCVSAFRVLAVCGVYVRGVRVHVPGVRLCVCVSGLSGGPPCSYRWPGSPPAGGWGGGPGRR